MKNIIYHMDTSCYIGIIVVVVIFVLIWFWYNKAKKKGIQDVGPEVTPDPSYIQDTSQFDD